MWKRRFDLIIDLGHRFSTQGPKSTGKPEFLSLRTYEIQDGKALFVWMQAQTATELLKEYCKTFRWTQKKNGVHFRDVYTFVVEIHDEDEVNGSVSKFLLSRIPLLVC
jgi:hypothetical protein